MSTRIETMTIELSPEMRPVLNSVAGETPDQKIAHLLLGEIRHHLEACEQERLELEIKRGLLSAQSLPQESTLIQFV